MNTLEFLSHLNTATKQWGLWINRDCPTQHHVGHYLYEQDQFPRSFIHVGTLEELAHLRQRYLLDHFANNKNEEELGRKWAEEFLSGWKAQLLVMA